MLIELLIICILALFAVLVIYGLCAVNKDCMYKRDMDYIALAEYYANKYHEKMLNKHKPMKGSRCR